MPLLEFLECPLQLILHSVQLTIPLLKLPYLLGHLPHTSWPVPGHNQGESKITVCSSCICQAVITQVPGYNPKLWIGQTISLLHFNGKSANSLAYCVHCAPVFCCWPHLISKYSTASHAHGFHISQVDHWQRDHVQDLILIQCTSVAKLYCDFVLLHPHVNAGHPQLCHAFFLALFVQLN